MYNDPILELLLHKSSFKAKPTLRERVRGTERSRNIMEKKPTSNACESLQAEESSDTMKKQPSTSNAYMSSENINNGLNSSCSTPAASIIHNHDFSGGLHMWHPNSCDAFVVSEKDGYPEGLSAKLSGRYAVITNRKECWQGLEQDITDRVSTGSTYAVCAWVRVSGNHGVTNDVQATLKLEYQDFSVSYLFIGRTSASIEHWEKLEGTFSLSTMPHRVIFYLEGPTPGIDLLIRSVVVSCHNPSQRDIQGTGPVFDGDENIIQNPRFDDGLNNWSGRGCQITLHYSMADGKVLPVAGKFFGSTANRTDNWNGIQQEITGRVKRKIAYEVTAFVRIFGNNITTADVRATLWLQAADHREQYIGIASVQATDKDWVELRGKFLVNGSPSKAVIYLEGPPKGTDILLNNLVVKHAAKLPPASPPIIENINNGLNSSCSTPAANIIHNHDFSEGLHMWHPNSCDAFVVSEKDGYPEGLSAKISGRYAVITNRKECWQGLEQDITDRVSTGSTYAVCAWVRVSGNHGVTNDVQATLKLEYQDFSVNYLFIGRTSASIEHWEKLEGTFSLSTMPHRVIFYLEGPSPGIDLLIRSVVVSCHNPSQRDIQGTGPVFDGDENIVQNPTFDDGLNNWSGRGCQIALHYSMADGKVLPVAGKFFGSTANRTDNWNGIQQEITRRVKRKIAYEVTAFVRIFGNNITTADVRATLWLQAADHREQYIGIASVQATDKDWVELRGKFLVNGSPSKAIIYVEGPPKGTDILLNNLVVKHAAKLPPASPPVIEDAAFGINIIANSNLTDGTKEWFPLGNCNLSVANGSPRIIPPMAGDSLGAHEPLSGRYILVTNRSQTWMGPAQMITNKLKLYLTYQVSAWVRIGKQATRPQSINVALDVDGEWVNGGQVECNADGWHEIGGSFRIEKKPAKVMVYVQGPEAGVDLMLAGLQIFPVDRHHRFRHLKLQTDKIRKRDVILKFTASDSTTLVGSTVKIKQTENSFPFGSCISRSNIDNEDIVDFFTKNFNWAVFENELKWYWTEPQQGNFNYRDADDLLSLCTSHNIHLRGHCIFWESEAAVQSWIRALPKNEMLSAVQNRLTGLITRYKGKFKHYDVNNEMLHNSFFQDHLGNEIRANMFKTAKQLDPEATLFVNDYNIEDGCDSRSSPDKYIQHILHLQEQGAPVGGIGVQGHITSPVGPVVSSAFNKLAVLGLPIWLTELDVSSDNEHVRADDLEVMMREAFGHPAVEGVMLWGFWELFMSREKGFLVNAEGDLNEAGKRYVAVKKEWLTHSHGYVNEEAEFQYRGFHGTYQLELVTPSKHKLVKTFVVDQGLDPLVISINF